MRTIFTLLLILSSSPAFAGDPLILALGDDSFEVREAAFTKLRALGWMAATRLRAAREDPDIEVRQQVRRLYEEAAIDHLNSFGPFPMIDSLWYDPILRHYEWGGAIQAMHEHFLDESGGRDPLPYINYRLATKLLVRDWLDADVPDWRIEYRLFWMQCIDALWVKDWKLDDEELMEIAVLPWQRRLFEKWAAGRVGTPAEAP